jgi:hypothetical protein
MKIARTFSGPNASAERKQVSAESTPPDTPTTAREKPAWASSLRMKSTRVFRAMSVSIIRDNSSFFIDPFDPFWVASGFCVHIQAKSNKLDLERTALIFV